MASHAQLIDAPVWNYVRQRAGIVEHAADAVAATPAGRIGLVAEQLLAAGDAGELQACRLQWLDGPRPEALPELTVRLGGAGVTVRSESVGASGLRLLVPAVAAPTPIVVALGSDAELTATLRPVRHFEVHLVQHSHYDIGYTDRQHVVRHQHRGYLDDVLRLVRDTDELPEPARFRWNEEALFAVTDWLAHRPEALRKELLERVAQSRVSLSAMPFNLHTEMCSTDELHELLRPALRLKQRYGLDFRVAMQTDVPGQVVGLPDALAELGVEFLSVAHNWAGRSAPDTTGQLALPRLFRWQGPEGGSVVVWRTDTPHGMSYMESLLVGLHESYEVVSDVFGAYLSALAGRPYPLPVGGVFGWLADGVDVSARAPYPWDVLHLRTHGRWSDNAGPSRVISDIVAEWNTRWRWPRLRVSTNEAFLDTALARHGNDLFTFTGDWNDWWAHGVGAAVAPVALGRRAQNDLADAQTLAAAARLLDPGADPAFDPDEGYRQLALWDEHTWGAANSWEHQDHGGSAGEHQWYWKVARAYAAMDEAALGLERARGALSLGLPRAAGAAVSVYAFNTGGADRDDELEVFLPAGTVPLEQPVALVDGRTGERLPHAEHPEPAGSRGLGRYLRSRVGGVPAVGYVRLDVVTADRPPAPARELADPTRLENAHLAVRLDLATGTVASLVDKASGRELVNRESAFGFNAYVYDRYATVGRSNHNSSKFADDGGLFLISSRDVAGPAAVVSAAEDERGQHVVLEQRVAGADWLRVTYRLPADLPYLEIVDRLRKPRTWDKESAYLAFPFAAADPVVLTESAGGLTGPGVPQVPGGAEYMRAVRHFVSIVDGEYATAWASADVPLVEVGTIALPYVPFPSTLPVTEPGTVFSWLHNNIWDTNFPVEQAFETDLRFRVAGGRTHGPALAAATAAALVRPLRPVLAEHPGGEAPAAASLLAIADPRVQLVGLQALAEDRVLVRLVSHAPEGTETELRLPTGVQQAWRSTYLGEPLEPLPVGGGTVPVRFRGAGVRAVLLGL